MRTDAVALLFRAVVYVWLFLDAGFPFTEHLGSTLVFKTEELFHKDYQFASEDLCAIHEEWLGDIYPIAGKHRTVSMSKDGFLFAAPLQISRLMEEFQINFLNKYTPCNFEDPNKIIEALAIVHVEFILIHPFREGNGRLGRLLASLMANQSGLPPLDFKTIDQNVTQKGFRRYIDAIHHGVNCNYEPMKDIFKKIITDANR